MTGRLEGKTAFVTGGAGGIGRAICTRFAAEGARVVAADLAPWEGPPEGVRAVSYDVTSEDAAKDAMSRIETHWGKLDILVNAAGIEIEHTIEDTTLEDWNRIFAINVTGTFLTSKHALPLLRKSGGASVINFGSYDGFIADPGLAAYCATKGAVHALTRAMACDHGPEGIRVNAICPGYVDTPMLQSFFEGEGSGGGSGTIETLQQAVRDVHPTRTYGTPEDVANLALWLASDEARYASGQLWVLDGGLTAQVQQMRL
ncbi:MAG: SDR family oxidoreductase [Pseudomonadales bacterium]|nr:SDR family oxidoreductase [Pseudomonadales bacterium]NIX06592.1 SDR family oxidoreductase [Pseudomonadales bacterium]